MNCLICGAALPTGAMFCGDCGSSTSATPLSRTRPDPRPGDTTIIEPLRAGDVPAPKPLSVSVSVPVPAAAAAGLPVTPAVPVDLDAPEPDPAPAHRAAPGNQEATADEVSAEASDPRSPATGSHALVPEAVAATTFILNFSTGEQWAVSGTGLIGRRPLPQPTEYYDELIAVADRGLSVSKSHLEFGQHAGQLWVCDRFSGNGTVIRRPHESPLRCDPGRRYLVSRGTRVDIGEQHFTIE